MFFAVLNDTKKIGLKIYKQASLKLKKNFKKPKILTSWSWCDAWQKAVSFYCSCDKLPALAILKTWNLYLGHQSKQNTF